MEKEKIIEKMKIKTGDDFLEESDAITFGDAIKLFRIMMESEK